MFKKLFTITLIFILFVAIFFLFFSESYKYSLEARVKYMLGDYKKARKLARKAFDLDPYNKMAFSILAQSKISVELIDYIQDSQKYLKKIDFLSNKQNFSQADKTKIKLYCEIQIEKYKKLTPTVMTDKNLYKQATKYYKEFKDIHENLFKK